MKKIYRQLDFHTAISWISLIFVFIIIPIFQVYSGEFKLDGKVIELEWWFYLLAIFIWDWFIIIFLIAISMIGMMFTKLHNYLTKDTYDINIRP